jgi:hypothetical protein
MEKYEKIFKMFFWSNVLLRRDHSIFTVRGSKFFPLSKHTLSYIHTYVKGLWVSKDAQFYLDIKNINQTYLGNKMHLKEFIFFKLWLSYVLSVILKCGRVSILHNFFCFAKHETKRNKEVVSRNFACFAKHKKQQNFVSFRLVSWKVKFCFVS